jgi:nitrite reductase (NADH) small subunit
MRRRRSNARRCNNVENWQDVRRAFRQDVANNGSCSGNPSVIRSLEQQTGLCGMHARSVADSAFIEVARLDEIAARGAIVVEIPLASVALFVVDGRVFAIDDACVRCGGSLAQGVRRAESVACPQCGWRYDVTTGCVEGVPALCTDRFEIRIEGTRVLMAAVCMASG